MMMSSPIIQLFFSLLPRILESERIFSFSTEAPSRKSRWTFSLILRPPNWAIAHYAGLSGVAWKSSPLFSLSSSSPQTPRTCQKHPLLCSHGGSRASSIYQNNETMLRKEREREELHKEMKNHHFIVAPAGGSAPWWWCLWCCSERCYFFSCAECVGTEPVFRVLFFSVLPSTSSSESWQLREIVRLFSRCSHFSSTFIMFSFLIKSLTTFADQSSCPERD